MNAATDSARFNALLVEGDKGLGLESALREQGCNVRRAASPAAAQDLEDLDIVVISANGFTDDDVFELVSKAVLSTPVVVATDNTALALKAAKLGATPALGASIDLVGIQVAQALQLSDLKRRSRQSQSAQLGPNSSVVQRRSTPLPKEATPDALGALIAAAEGLVPMHRFQRVYVDYALRRFGGNKVHTAAALGIDRRTIQRWARARSESPVATTAPTTTSSTSS